MNREQRTAFLAQLGAILVRYDQLTELRTVALDPERVRDQWDHAVCRALDDLGYQPDPNEDPVAWHGPFLDAGADAFPWIGARLDQTTDDLENHDET